jgi:hypothetical protein
MPVERVVDEFFPPLILPEIRSLVAEADGAGIAEVVEALHPASLAAVASSPLITTVADATGLALYFSVARLILPAFS